MGRLSLPVCAALLSGVVAQNGNGNANRNANRQNNRNGGSNQNANQNANRNANRTGRAATREAGQPTYYPTWEPTYMPTWYPTTGLEMVELGGLCRNNKHCQSGNCYFGVYDNQDEGICECSLKVDSCNGAKCAPGPTGGKGTPMNVCVDFPNGAVCKANSDCLSRDCWLGGAGKAKVGECQCKTCLWSGCGSCQTGENCPMTVNSKPKMCREGATARPTPSPSVTPIKMGLGHVCLSDMGCKSESCYMEEGQRQGICQCSRQKNRSCGGGGGTCTSPVRGGLKQCVDVPTGKVCFHDEQCASR